MSGRARIVAALMIVGPIAGAAAEPRLWTITPPFRTTMAMRAPVTAPTPPAVATAPTAASTTAPAPSAPAADDPLRFDSSLVARRRARTRRADQQSTVHAQLTAGFALDGASPSSTGVTLAGAPLADGPIDRPGYARARAYGFGALYLGGRNLLVPGLAGYLAAEARIRPSIPAYAPVPTAWDQTDTAHALSAWAEADGVFATPILRPLTIRAGRQYVYGPFIAHLDGLHVRWRRDWLDVAVYAGSRSPDWSARADADLGLAPQRGPITGAAVAIDLRRSRLPVTLRLRALAYENHGHADLTVDTRLRRGLDLTALARTYDGAIAHEQVTVRYRLSDRTRLVIDGHYRHRRDVLWDLAYRGRDLDQPDDGAEAARRYLDLGPRLPRATLRVRAGTVLLDNVDLLLSGGAALDARAADDPTTSLYADGWVEGGGALEVRVRRTFALGVSGLGRRYSRSDPMVATPDVEDQLGPLLLDPELTGERTLYEGGLSARFSGGARKFSVAAELYARRTRYAEHYRDDGISDDDGDGFDDAEDIGVLPEGVSAGVIDQSTFRGGGRITLDAWITERVRLRGEYDFSTAIELAPEVNGIKALRIVAEGTL